MTEEDIFEHNLEEELIQDLTDNFHESYEVIERNLSTLVSNPGDQPLIDECFRAIHSVKSNATVCELDPVIHFSQAIEDVIYAIKTGKINYGDSLCEAVLISLDRLKEIIDSVINFESLTDYRIEDIHSLLTKIARSSADEYLEFVKDLVASISGEFKTTRGAKTKAQKALQASNVVEEETTTDQEKEDLRFFLDLGKRIDKQNPVWSNRTREQIDLALKINIAGGNPVSVKDLTAAVCLHDVGMAFVPYEIISKQGKLTPLELKAIQNHAVHGAHIAGRMTLWKSTEEMILQHHERPDGNGYPNKVKDQDLCDGARIIAIVDAYYAMTHLRADRTHKRSELRAVSEINACKGTQFCPKWVDIFNSILLSKSRKK